MKNYLALAPKYLTAHQKKTRLTIVSVAIAVALITGIFSMLEVFLKFEKIQVIHDFGNYHMTVNSPSPTEIKAIESLMDVNQAGRWFRLGEGKVEGVTGEFGAIDENFAENMNIRVIEGHFPAKPNEIMIEQWATEGIFLNAKLNDTIRISAPGLKEGEYVVSGIYNDLGNRKASGSPGVLLSPEAAGAGTNADNKATLLIQFKDGVNVNQAANDLRNRLHIAESRTGLNTRLLAVTGQSNNNTVMGLYAAGAVLFFIVLIAGVVMIYNIFNISVMDRVRHFGLLRCIGASGAQIRKLVRREGLRIMFKAIPIGVIVGMLVTFICSAILKFYNDELFADIPLYSVSPIGIAAGIILGFLTVYMASLLPARKAARVSPVNAVTGSSELKPRKQHKRGLLTRMFHVEIALGFNNAVMKKKTLMLMASSIAISIIMFLGFQVFVVFLHSGIKTTKPYSPDITLTASAENAAMDDKLYRELMGIDGIKRVYGRKMDYVKATFDSSKLPDNDKSGRDSWLISYDQQQLDWSKKDLIDGELSEARLNEGNGVIAVAFNMVNNRTSEAAQLKVGDQVDVETPNGTKRLKVMGVLRSVPFSSSEPVQATFITTERLFKELTGQSGYQVLNVQLGARAGEQATDGIKQLITPRIEYLDMRQQNAENDQTFFTMAVFIYGFVAVIGLISILNIINTMSTSVAQKVRYFGVMRAIGMSGGQLNKMVVVEAASYTLSGYIMGLIFGLLLQKALISGLMANLHLIWTFPYVQVLLILIVILFVTVLSVIGPLKRVKHMGISEVVNSL